MTPDDHQLPDDEPEHEVSATGAVLEELALYGHHPFTDEPDTAPLPEARAVERAVADIFDAMVSTFEDTRLEADLEHLLWGITNVFHRAGERVDRELDYNETMQKRLQREQDGSEVRSVELERALAEGLTLMERLNAMEFFRDACADQFLRNVRKPWTPRSGSKVNRKALTSAVIDSRDFLNNRRWTDKQVLFPPGERIAFTGGADFNDHALIRQVLDSVLAKYPKMVLLHGGARRGAEAIAASWADTRKVPQVPIPPKFRHRDDHGAPFRRNDVVLEAMPIGVIVFPGGGIQDNLADKAKTMGIRLMDYRKRGGA